MDKEKITTQAGVFSLQYEMVIGYSGLSKKRQPI
jgi:hypothetical protein